MLKDFIKENMKNKKQEDKKEQSDKELFFYKDGDFKTEVYRKEDLVERK